MTARRRWRSTRSPPMSKGCYAHGRCRLPVRAASACSLRGRWRRPDERNRDGKADEDWSESTPGGGAPLLEGPVARRQRDLLPRAVSTGARSGDPPALRRQSRLSRVFGNRSADLVAHGVEVLVDLDRDRIAALLLFFLQVIYCAC